MRITDTSILSESAQKRLADSLAKQRKPLADTKGHSKTSESVRKPLKHKFNAKRTETDGIKFASKKEAKRYQELKLLQEQGEIVFFLRQVPLHLEGNTKYVCDWLIFYADGSAVFEDTKGMLTPTFKLKKKQVEAKYPIEIVLS